MNSSTHARTHARSKYHTKCWLKTKTLLSKNAFHPQFPPGFSMLLIYSAITWGNVNLKTALLKECMIISHMPLKECAS